MTLEEWIHVNADPTASGWTLLVELSFKVKRIEQKLPRTGTQPGRDLNRRLRRSGCETL